MILNRNAPQASDDDDNEMVEWQKALFSAGSTARS